MSEWKGRVGILMIGSLYWDDSDHRRAWRSARLDLDARRYVRAPIRYGRFSKTRSSHTMVLSNELASDRYGRAIAVPCTRRVRSAADVMEEAVHLWTAEKSSGKNRLRRVSASWGCVGLLPNPNRAVPVGLRGGWIRRIAGAPCYGRLKAAAGEAPAVNESGFLTIPWPEPEDGSALDLDLLLATATDPNTVEDYGRYPTALEIADKCGRFPGGTEYFRKNREHGIRTFEDDTIERWLRIGQPGA